MDNKWHSSFAFIYIKKRNHNIEFPMERDTYKTPKLESSLNKITVFLLVNAGNSSIDTSTREILIKVLVNCLLQ